MDIYSGNRSEINNKLTDYLDKEFRTAYGIEVLDASIIDSHPDDKLQETIDARVKAQQAKAQAEAEQKTVEVEAKTKMIEAQNEAEIKITEANAEAEANRVISESITEELIRMKEAEARLEHGWVTVQGADSVVTDAREK
jgi:regulator of protease activity HflC (stomatin/prohibitin superfamily)